MSLENFGKPSASPPLTPRQQLARFDEALGGQFRLIAKLDNEVGQLRMLFLNLEKQNVMLKEKVQVLEDQIAFMAVS